MQPDLAAQQFCVRIELLLTVDDQLLRDDAQSISCHSFIKLHAAYLVIRKVDSANVDQRIWKKREWLAQMKFHWVICSHVCAVTSAVTIDQIAVRVTTPKFGA